MALLDALSVLTVSCCVSAAPPAEGAVLICIAPPSEYVSHPMRARQETPVTPASEPPPTPPESFICPVRSSGTRAEP
ncbi:hypothetical protein QQF64_005250 [Cirrhinus molitorella]|uniref:Secreted protein n=1 Tax=Cirrhinus molitorella TaxID=172907 RepID=A0ABR3MJS7_9TELE